MDAYRSQKDNIGRLNYLSPNIAAGIFLRFDASGFIDIYKCTDVGFSDIPGWEQLWLLAPFESSTTTNNPSPMAYTNNINYNSYRPGSKMNPRLRQLAILSLVVLVGMMISIFVNA